MIISLINKSDSPISDNEKFHAFSLGGNPSPDVKYHDGDDSAYQGDDLRPMGIPRYYVDSVSGDPSGPLKRYSDVEYNALAEVKEAKDESQMEKHLAQQQKMEALKAMKADTGYTAVSNTKIDKYIAKMKARRDA